ncbi:MAG TPA: hypothetical protein VH500_12645 [Nitrososphaeraceae archaeon]
MSITGPIPSYYFPISTYENLIEKFNELYRSKVAQTVPSAPQAFPSDALAMLTSKFPYQQWYDPYMGHHGSLSRSR